MNIRLPLSNALLVRINALFYAAIVTLVMLFFMQRLIDQELPEFVEEEPPKFPEVSFEETPIEPLKRKVLVRPTDPVEPPKITLTPPTSQSGPNSVQIVVNQKYTPPSNTAITLSSANLPVARVLTQPRYPNHALRRGTEGFVDVYFDVTEFGVPINIRVLRSQPEGVFEKAALAAVERWKFQPVVRNGQPQLFEGMTRRVRFTLQK